MDQVNSIVNKAWESPKKVITYTWLTSLILLAVTFIIVCVAGSYMNNGGLDKVVAFSGIWSIIIFIIISAGGTIIMRQYQSGLAIGIFSGVVLVMSSQMLIIFALFVDRVQNGHHGSNQEVAKAMAVMTFLLFIVYGFFGLLLIIFQKEIVREGDSQTQTGTEKNLHEDEERVEDLPPENI